MKKTLFLLLLLSQYCSGQDSLAVTETIRNFSLGSKNAFVIDIPQTNFKSVRANWRTYLKQQSKRSVSEKSGEFQLPAGPVNNVSTDSITIYSTIVSEGKNVKLCTYVMSGDTNFLSSSTNSEQANAISHFIRKFAVEEYKRGVNFELIDEKNKQSELEKKVDNLDNENEGLKKDIKKNERTISRTQDNISSNEQEQTMKSTSILQQKTLLNSFVGSVEARDKEEKILKQLTKEKEKLQDKKESMLKSIDDLDSENRGIQKRVDKNTDDKIPELKNLVTQQKAVVNAVTTKMNSIQ